MKKYIILAALVLAFGLTMNAEAALVTIQSSPDGTGANLFEIYNTFYGETIANNAALPQNDLATGLGLYATSGGTLGHIARYAEFELDLYQYNGGSTLIGTFAGATTPATYNSYIASYGVPANSLFGMYGDSTWGGTWYSQIGLNSDSLYHFVVIDHPDDPNKLFIGFEDQTNPDADWDYNDFVFELENVVPIPEPMTLSLLGLGLLGLAGFKKKF